MKFDLLLVLSCWFVANINAFVQNPKSNHDNWARVSSKSISSLNLFEDDPDMVPVAEHYVRNKYRLSASGEGYCDKKDVTAMLKSLLPPVTSEELNQEVSVFLTQLRMLNCEDEEPQYQENQTEEECLMQITEDDFVKIIVKNSYWQSAGDLVVKELIYFDALYHFYHANAKLLDDQDFEELKENLVWEGSSVASMNKDEALFVSAVAAARRGEPLMEDETYSLLKKKLKDTNSWVTARKQDALEKMAHLETFLGYLHRSIKEESSVSSSDST